MRLAWVIPLVLTSCTPEYRQPTASPTPPGLRTKLIALTEDLAVGKPLKFRLELTNGSDSTFIYNDQRVSAGSLHITAPDGSRVKYIDIPRQTSGSSALLRPGETVVLFDDGDVEDYFMIVYPGRYQFQFDGYDLHIIDAREVPLLALLAAGQDASSDTGDQWFEETGKLSKSTMWVRSDIVTLNLKPARPPESALFAERLLRIVPKGWDLGVTNIVNEGGIKILIQNLEHLKSETATVEVLLTGRTLEELGERICAWDGRNVYASANPKAAQLWPDFRVKVAQSLIQK